jgi:hypothetical protein
MSGIMVIVLTNLLKNNFIMKRFTILLLLGAFLIGGAIFHSCKKDEMQEVKNFDSPAFKITDSYALPIFMDTDVEIGYATISFNYDPADPVVSVDITLNSPYAEDWEITEAHFYFDGEAPTKPSPGKFTYHWYLGEEPAYPEPGFDVPAPILEDLCLGFDYYYAIHIALETCILEEEGVCLEWDYETGWVLPEGGIVFTKPNGAQMGWGEYFQWHIDYIPDIDQIDLYASINEDLSGAVPVTNTGGFDYEMCLDPAVPYYYFDAELIMGNPLLIEEGTMNGFLLQEVTDPGFWDYWLLRGVDGVNNAQGWELFMWDIINGVEPMFYVKRVGSDYMVIDGLQYLLFDAGVPGYTG